MGWGNIDEEYPSSQPSQYDFREKQELRCPICEFTTQDPIAYMRHKQTAHDDRDINIS